MNEETKQALRELKEWCKKYGAVIEQSPNMPTLIQISFGHDLRDIDRVHFGQFSQNRTTVISEQRESI